MTEDEIRDAVAAISDAIPFNRLLGLSLTEFGENQVTVAFESRPDLVGNILRGILHGGVISATLDLVGGLTALTSTLHGREVTSMEEIGAIFAKFGTIDLRVDYLRPGEGRSFRGIGTVLRSGRRVAVTRMELVSDSDVVVAVGTGTYITG